MYNGYTSKRLVDRNSEVHRRVDVIVKLANHFPKRELIFSTSSAALNSCI